MTDLRPYIPLLVVLALPFLACLLILLVEPGIERALLYSGVKVGVVLVVIAGALSFAASHFAGRGES